MKKMKNKPKNKIIFVAVIMVVTLLTGCGDSENNGYTVTMQDFAKIFNIACVIRGRS